MSHRLSRLPATRDRLTQGLTDGLHIGAQVYVSVKGVVIADAAVGEARPGFPMRPDTVMRWLSAGKPVAAVAIAQLVERGLIAYDRLVAEYVPEFAQNGKQAVTVRHVLTHTGGFRGAEPATMLPTWKGRVAGIYAAPLEEGWVPGQKAGYHPNSGWIILGEIVRRVSGVPFERYARANIFEPLGMTDSWTMATPELAATYGGRWGELHLTENGSATGGHPVHSAYSTEASINVLRPGSTLRGPARDLGRLYEMLLSGGAAPGTGGTIPSPSQRERRSAIPSHSQRDSRRAIPSSLREVNPGANPSSPQVERRIAISSPSQGEGQGGGRPAPVPDAVLSPPKEALEGQERTPLRHPGPPGADEGRLSHQANSRPLGPRILSPESAAEITRPQRVGMFDETFKHVMDWGLGVIIDSKRYGSGVPYGFGQSASPRAFGHGGAQSSVGFADPEHGLVVALVFNGLPGEARHDRRLKRVTAAIYEDLGLVSAGS